MKRILGAICSLLLCISVMAQRNSNRNFTPDFAFPEKVEQEAEKDLDEALKKADGPGIVNAIVRAGLAKTAVSNDCLPQILQRISLIEEQSNDIAVKSLLNVLQANIYANIYSADSYRINRRDNIAGMAGDDYLQWSKREFTDKVSMLTAKALEQRDSLMAIPLETYKDVVKYDRSSLVFYPTLYDFVAAQIIDIYNDFDNRGVGILNPELALDPLNKTLYPIEIPGNFVVSTLNLYNSLIVGREYDAPGVFARRNLIDFILDNVFVLNNNHTPWLASRRHFDHSRYDAFMKAYHDCAASPYAAEILVAIQAYYIDNSEKKKLLAIVDNYLAQNPEYFNINAVKNLRSEIVRQSVDIDVPSQVMKGMPYKVKVSVNNVNKVTISLYDVTLSSNPNDGRYYRMPKRRMTPVSETVVEFSGEEPFEDEKLVDVTMPEYGRYVIVPAFDGDDNGRAFPIIICSDLSAAAVSGVGSTDAVAVNAMTGAPEKGVTMFYQPWSRRATETKLPGYTDAQGFLSFKKSESGNIFPRRGQDKYSNTINFYNEEPSSSRRDLNGSIFTSLNLYRLGDNVDFSIVAYEYDNGAYTLANNRSLTVILRDANYQEVDTLRVTTDEWGRAQGVFTLPDEGLTGSYTISFNSDNGSWISKSFTVSDYKLPTFAVEVTDVNRPASKGDSAFISGEALTFAGFPIDGANIKLQLSVRTGFWFWAQISPVFYEVEAFTDASGKFIIEIPGSVIASSPAPDGYFIADISVTSLDGETQQVSSGFNMGKPMTIQVTLPDVCCVDEPDNEMKVEMLDFKGVVANKTDLNYVIKTKKSALYGGKAVYTDFLSGKCTTGNVDSIITSLPSGEYFINFEPVDSSLSDEVNKEIIIYRKNDLKSPVNRMLWIQETDLVADTAGVVNIPYATAVGNANILMILSDSDGKVVEKRWLKPSTGMSSVSVTLPNSEKSARVNFNIVSNLKSVSQAVFISPYVSQKSIKITVESFRDKVTPGNTEKIKFKISGLNGAESLSAVMLNMSNKAIDVLARNSLTFNVANYTLARYITLNGFRFTSEIISVSNPFVALNSASIDAPFLNLYGRYFYFNDSYRFGSGPQLALRGKSEASVTMEIAECAVAVNDCALEESAVTGSVPEVSKSEQKNNEDNKDVYRPSEIPLAFFQPMLVTDNEGNIEVSYTVPDANTTWILRSLAYNRDLQTATESKEIVASKPLMVSTNAPRFLRSGDKVRLLASVMNATDSSVVAITDSELLDITTGRVLASSKSTGTISAVGRKVVELEYQIPADIKGLIYRVKATGGDFSDGEQCMIPVLASQQDIVESDIFYLAPGENHFTKQIGAVNKGRVYLKFTENPIWEVVSALPGLRKSTINSSLEAASAIFSAAVADGLMKQYPEIARTLRRWSENPTDSALVSELEKNEELKTILLNSTPWVSESLSMTERMQRLILLLDSKNTSREIEKGISNLAKNVTSDGGWSWTPNYSYTSEWCTMNILDMFGDLNRLGWLPHNEKLSNMINNAVLYLDRTVAARYKKYPKTDFTDYCYTRGKYPEVKQSTAASKVTNVTVQRIIAEWKNHSVVIKAVDAIVLNDNGYNATARQILKSLEQYATVTPEKGMYWQQLEHTLFRSYNKVGCTSIILDAFALVDSANPSVDKIRQWVILQKENTDWGNTVLTSQVISSILTSGADWTIKSEGTAIRVGNSLITPAVEEFATGSFTEQITDKLSTSSIITIDRQGNYPSFGSVIKMYRTDMNNVRSVACFELGVEKRMSVFDGEKWIPSDNFNVGDRVKVTLVLKVNTDMDYVVIQDFRAATFEPVEQLPTPVWSEGLCFYRENRDSQTNLFIDRLPCGTYVLDYELFATQSGTFASGVASVQSQYNPAITAHSAGMIINVK